MPNMRDLEQFKQGISIRYYKNTQNNYIKMNSAQRKQLIAALKPVVPEVFRDQYDDRIILKNIYEMLTDIEDTLNVSK